MSVWLVSDDVKQTVMRSDFKGWWKQGIGYIFKWIFKSQEKWWEKNTVARC